MQNDGKHDYAADRERLEKTLDDRVNERAMGAADFAYFILRRSGLHNLYTSQVAADLAAWREAGYPTIAETDRK